MATTALIVEILVIGILGLVWIILLVFQFSDLDINQIGKILSGLKDWSALYTLLFIGVIYQLGWLINGLGFLFTNGLFEKKIRNKMFEEAKLDYHAVRPTVYQNASPKVCSDMALERSIMRLSRSGIINFFLISVALILNGDSIYIFFPIALVLSFGCYAQWRYRYKRYYKRMIESFRIIITDKKNKA